MPERQVSSSEFTIVIAGPAVSRTYPLFGVSAILLNITTILRDSAIDVIVPNLRTTARVDIELDAGFPREGSYVQDIVLKVVEFVQQNAAPIILAIPIPEIIKHANQTLELADRLRKFLHRERKLHVERVEEGTLALRPQGFNFVCMVLCNTFLTLVPCGNLGSEGVWGCAPSFSSFSSSSEDQFILFSLSSLNSHDLDLWFDP
jgi:hypothetical protein